MFMFCRSNCCCFYLWFVLVWYLLFVLWFTVHLYWQNCCFSFDCLVVWFWWLLLWCYFWYDYYFWFICLIVLFWCLLLYCLILVWFADYCLTGSLLCIWFLLCLLTLRVFCVFTVYFDYAGVLLWLVVCVVLLVWLACCGFVDAGCRCLLCLRFDLLCLYFEYVGLFWFALNVFA